MEGQIEDTAKARGISREAVTRDVLLAAQPTKQFVQPGQVASLVVYLAGGAHGAFTWGVLDRLLEDKRIYIEVINAGSARAR